MRNLTRNAALAAASALVLAGLGSIGATATAAEGCRVDYATPSQWGGQFQADVVVTNLGSPVTSWEVTWSFPAGQRVLQAWGATATASGATASFSNASYNGSLGTGASAGFGFIGSWQGSNPAPTSIELNGVPCTGTVVAPDPDPDPDPTPDPTPDPVDPPASATGTLYVDTATQAARAAAAASGETKVLLNKIAQTPQAYWVGSWTDAQTAKQQVTDYTGRAVGAGAIPVLVVYAIPGRDCGSYSGGGVATSEYAAWIDTIASGIQGEPWVILEPDALAQLGDCEGQGDRVGYLRYAAQKLTEAGAHVYIDAGHSGWLTADEAAERLQQIGFEYAEGFALNTSNYQTTAASTAYGEAVSSRLGGVPYVIDTSRNGNGSNGEWCNPRGRALGERPRLVDDSTNLAALLWVKLPGESDGSCNGGPAAGQWWQEIAVEMARNASW